MTDTVHAGIDVDRRLAALEERYPSRSLPTGAQVVRVAPSPTGRPTMGTALQATIDYALARATNGVFILRIEDTDRARLHPGAIEELIEALDWLQVPADEGPVAGGRYGSYIESERLDIYRVVCDWLVEHGRAYPCFCSPERLAELRAAQTAARQPTRYDRRCRDLTSEERERRSAAGEQCVVRLAIPLSGAIVYHDPVRGAIEFDAADQDDPVIMKSDGFPTYHLAAMVDDHFMRVTTVVRGEEWISSTPKHLTLFTALDWEPPAIVHTPLLRDAQGRKLSKRSGDTSIAWYRGQGYLPEGFRNFLTRIIWTHPEGKDVYPYGDFIRGVAPEALPKTGPIVNPSLLDFISNAWLRTLDTGQLYERTVHWLRWLLDGYVTESITFEVPRKQEREKHEVSRAELAAFARAFTADPAYSRQVLSLEPERYDKLGDIVLQTRLYYRDLFAPPPAEVLLDAARGDRGLAAGVLSEYLEWFTGDQEEASWEERVDAMARAREIKRGVPFMLLRVAITGSKQTPPLYGIIRVLGADEVRRRVQMALRRLSELPPSDTHELSPSVPS
jgi:glutamyl-tRNA synthetase